MENDIKVRKVTQDVLLFVWFRNKVITQEPSPELSFMPEISADFVNELSISIWMESIKEEVTWKNYLSNHFERMTSSPQQFATYVAYACFLAADKTTDAYKCFFDALSLVSYFGVYCWERESKIFINACVELFCAFFEKRIRTNFERQGGWEHISEYLEDNFHVMTYRSFIRTNECPFEYFNEYREMMGQRFDISHLSKDPSAWDVKRRRVETHKGAIRFVKSVAEKISELCKKELDEILTDFERTDHQVKALHLQRVEKASKGMSFENVLLQKLQKEEPQPGPSKLKSGKKEKQTVTSSDPCEIQKNLDNINPQDVDASDKALHENPKAGRSERIKSMVEDMSMDLAKLSGIIKPEKKEKQPVTSSDPCEIQKNLDNINPQDVDASDKALLENPKSGRSERMKYMVEDMSTDLAQLSGIIKSLCQEHGVQTPEWEEAESKV